MDSIKINHGKTLMIAHRGLSGIEKENTLPAFVAAGNRSYFGVETDVHRTADGLFVVIHDETTGRVAGGDSINVEESSFATVRGIILADTDGERGRADLRIPTLKEYAKTCRRYGKKAVLELKNEFSKEDIGRICDELLEGGELSDFIFISFCFVNLVRLRELYPDTEVQYLIEGSYDDKLPGILEKEKFDLDIQYDLLTPEIIGELHSRGIKINCWTVNDPAAGEELCRLGVDFITSNILE